MLKTKEICDEIKHSADIYQELCASAKSLNGMYQGLYFSRMQEYRQFMRDVEKDKAEEKKSALQPK